MEKQRYYSLWLCAILIIAYLIQVLVPGFTEMLMLTSEAFPNVWQFFTAIFLHGSLIHLLFNLFALFLFGLMLEALVGSRKFLLIFIITGILANLISWYWSPNALGASGAIFGVIGVLVILKPMMGVWAFGMILPMFVAAILWVGAALLGVFGFGDQGIGYWAHLSGIVLGMFYGVWLRIRRREPPYERGIKLPEEAIRNWEDYYIRP